MISACSVDSVDPQPIKLEEALEPTPVLYFRTWTEYPEWSNEEWINIRVTWDRPLAMAHGSLEYVMDDPRWKIEPRGCIYIKTNSQVRPHYIRVVSEGVDSIQIVQ